MNDNLSKLNKQRFLIILSVFAIFALVTILSLIFGSYEITLNDLFRVLFGRGNETEKNIIINLRLSRLLLGLAVGSSLSLAGIILQAIFKNPLVEPYTVGISGGASFAVCLAVISGIVRIFGSYALYIAGFCGAISVVALLYIFNLRGIFRNIFSLLLAGISCSFVFSSLIMLLLSISRAEESHGILFWLMGSLSHSSIHLSIFAFLSSLFLFLASLFFHKCLDALLLGEEQAFLLGINPRKTQMSLFILASLLTSVAVALSGIIGFVGLAIPILMRKLTGNKHLFLIPASYIAGGTFLSFCDLIARTIISPRELPVGVITGLIGGTIFIFSVIKQMERKNAPPFNT